MSMTQDEVLSAQCSDSPGLPAAEREVLLRLASKQGHKGDHEALLNTDSLRLLMMLACAKEMRLRRHALLSGQEAHRVSLEAMEALMVRGWVEIHGQFVELTPKGNGLVCALLELVRKGGVVS